MFGATLLQTESLDFIRSNAASGLRNTDICLPCCTINKTMIPNKHKEYPEILDVMVLLGVNLKIALFFFHCILLISKKIELT